MSVTSKTVKLGCYTIESEDVQDEYGETNDMQSIDYSKTSFILKNLSIAVPKFDEDNSLILQSRHQLSEYIKYQVVFYCYCALYALLNVPTQTMITILVIGDGYYGSSIIHHLIAYGFAPLLRVFCRGDVSCNNWKNLGIKSECSLHTLFKDKPKPDIVITCTGNASFPSISKALANYVDEGTFMVTPTFGFIRKKLCVTLKTPTIFRTFVEPNMTLQRARTNAIKGAMHSQSREFGSLHVEKSNVLSSKVHSLVDDESDDEEDLRDKTVSQSRSFSRGESQDEQEFGLELGMSEGSQVHAEDAFLQFLGHEQWDAVHCSAYMLAMRVQQVKSMVYLVENFAVIRGIAQKDARLIALSAVFGLTWSGEQFTSSYIRGEEIESTSPQLEHLGEDAAVEESGHVETARLHNQTTSDNDTSHQLHPEADRIHDMMQSDPDDSRVPAQLLRSNNCMAAKIKRVITEIASNVYHDVVPAYHEEFSKFITLNEVYSLTTQYLEVLREHELRELQAQQQCQQELERSVSTDPGNAVLQRIHSHKQSAGQHAPVVMMDRHYLANNPTSKLHKVEQNRKAHALFPPLYAQEFVLQIYERDFDYRQYSGPGFDLMVDFDRLDHEATDDLSVGSIASQSVLERLHSGDFASPKHHKKTGSKHLPKMKMKK